ncbi:MAG: hypothetical protein ACRC6K_03750 [Fusobacteriaceae bacterium]
MELLLKPNVIENLRPDNFLLNKNPTKVSILLMRRLIRHNNLILMELKMSKLQKEVFLLKENGCRYRDIVDELEIGGKNQKNKEAYARQIYMSAKKIVMSSEEIFKKQDWSFIELYDTKD